jgi:hypothetical protein
MPVNSGFISCLVAIATCWLGTSLCRAAGELEVSRTATTQFDLAAEAAAFVESLESKNAEVKSKFEEITAETRSQAGGRFSVGKARVIEWLTPNFESDFRSGGGTRDVEQVLLVQQPLVAGFHHGYAVTENATSQVRVYSHSDYREDPKNPAAKEGFVLTAQKLTLRFEGFVKVTITPIP